MKTAQAHYTIGGEVREVYQFQYASKSGFDDELRTIARRGREIAENAPNDNAVAIHICAPRDTEFLTGLPDGTTTNLQNNAGDAADANKRSRKGERRGNETMGKSL